MDVVPFVYGSQDLYALPRFLSFKTFKPRQKVNFLGGKTRLVGHLVMFPVLSESLFAELAQNLLAASLASGRDRDFLP